MNPVVLSLLPVMMHLGRFHEAFFVGAVTALAAGASAVFFRAARPLFRGRLGGLGLILWMGILAGAVRLFWDLAPFWIVSFYLLAGKDALKNTQPALGFEGTSGMLLFWRSAGFWILAAALGLSQEILKGFVPGPLFSEPSGTLLILSLVAFFMKFAGEEAA